MSPAAWIAIAGIVVTLVVQTVGLAFWLGGMSARLRSVEGRPSNDDCATQLAALNATLTANDKANERRFADLEHTVRNLLTNKVASAPRRKTSA